MFVRLQLRDTFSPAAIYNTDAIKIPVIPRVFHSRVFHAACATTRRKFVLSSPFNP